MRIFLLSTLILYGAISQAVAADIDVGAAGLIAGDPAAASNNAKLLKKLVSPSQNGGSGNFEGTVTFGAGKIYYLDDVIAVKDNIHLDLNGSTLHFSKTAEPRDRSSGFLIAIRNFSVTNGKIEVDYDGKDIVHAGAALQLGQRASNGGVYFPKSYDSLLPAPMGNIEVSNLAITSNNPAACGIALFGGLVDVKVDSVQVDGQNRLVCGIYYEFGQATQPSPGEPFRTSHAHRMKFTNISIKDLSPSAQSIGMGFGGAYDVLLDGVTIAGAKTGFYGTAGESAFYRPWGDVPAQRTVTLRHVKMTGILGTAFNLSGAGEFSGGYLGRFIKDPSPDVQTDLVDYEISDFSAEGSGNGWGIYTSGGRTQISKGRLSGFVRGIVATEDARVIQIDGVDISGVRQQGIQLNFGSGIRKSTRAKTGFIRNCTIAPGSDAAGIKSPAITVNNAADMVISNNTYKVGRARSLAKPVYLGPTARSVRVERNKLEQ